jgi:hypothetical protein
MNAIVFINNHPTASFFYVILKPFYIRGIVFLYKETLIEGMDVSVEDKVHELFGMLLDRFAKQGVPPERIKKEMLKEIDKNIVYFWGEYKRNNDHFLFHMYKCWMIFEDRVDDYLSDTEGYEMMFNFYRTKEIIYFLN